MLQCTKEHDGVEIYALYILMFINIAVAVSVAGLMGKCIGTWKLRIAYAFCSAFSLFYCQTIGFIPPMNSLQDGSFFMVLSVMVVVFSIVAVLYYLQQRSNTWATAAVALLLAPVCFIATQPISWRDYTYIFAPSLRLLNGVAIRDIYFQYDLLPSLLAATWMKLGLALNTFQVLGQAAYFATILGVFLFSRKLFHKKELAVFLVTALVLGRIYASPWDAVCCFQVTPLRLDLWLPLLVVVYLRGPYHWSSGLVSGILLLLLKTFGIIYSLAYLQLLITLWAISYFDGRSSQSLGQSLRDYGKRCWLSVAIIILFGGASNFLFRNSEYGNYASYYQKIGFGFIQITSNSFYWYVPTLLSMVLILLFRVRKEISPTYLASGILLTYCAIGNSIYFFGRSHEHNILNIAIVLLFLLFFTLDLIALYLHVCSGKTLLRQHGVICVAITLIALIVVFYSHNIAGKAVTQIQNAENSQLIYPVDFDLSSLRGYIKVIRTVTGNSNRVYFVDRSDFALYYYGGYAPVGYCNPFDTWVFTKDLNRFLQSLLDNDYYLVCSSEMRYILTNLQYDFNTLIGDAVVAAKLEKPGT